MKAICQLLFSGLCAILLSVAVGAPSADAKELANRLGVGIADQFGLNTSTPAMQVKYYPSSDMGVAGLLGVDTEKGNSRFGFMAKACRIIFKEQNLNFYMGAGAGVVSQTNTTTNNVDSGFVVNGYAGTEFFFSGLENLGFSFELGLGVTAVSSQVRFRTIGDSPFQAGIVFYF